MIFFNNFNMLQNKSLISLLRHAGPGAGWRRKQEAVTKYAELGSGAPSRLALDGAKAPGSSQ